MYLKVISNRNKCKQFAGILDESQEWVTTTFNDQELEIIKRIVAKYPSKKNYARLRESGPLYNLNICLNNSRFRSAFDAPCFLSHRLQLLSILEDTVKNRGYMMQFLEFIGNKKIHKVLSGGYFSDKKQWVLDTLQSMMNNRRRFIDTAVTSFMILLFDPEFSSDKPNEQKLINDSINACLTKQARIDLNKGLKARFSAQLQNQFFSKFCRVALLWSLFRFDMSDLLDRVVIKEKADILTHPLASAFSLIGQNYSSIDIKKTLPSMIPQISDEQLTDIPVINDFSQLGLSNSYYAGRNIQEIKGDNGINFKLMAKRENLTEFNAEPFFYNSITNDRDSRYQGIVPHVEGSSGQNDIYLIKVSSNALESLGSKNPFIENSDLYKTEDGYYIGFCYSAPKNYFDYAHDFSPEDAVEWSKSIGILTKDYGIAHQELLALWHNLPGNRTYAVLENMPAGTIEAIDECCEFGNLRPGGTVADFGGDHLRSSDFFQTTVNPLFGTLLFVSQRMHKAGVKPKEFSIVLKQSFSEYLSIMAPNMPNDFLDDINFDYYARHILHKFSSKGAPRKECLVHYKRKLSLHGMREYKRQRGKKEFLGKYSGALSIHGLVDLVDLVSLHLLNYTSR